MKIIKYLSLSVLLSASSSVWAASAPQCIEDGCSLAKLKTLTALSARGNVEASFALGHIFMNRDSGIQTDLEKSFYYFERAARYRFWPAVRQTAGMLARGIGTEQNLLEARRLMRKAAEKNVHKAAEEYAVIVFSDVNSSEEERQYALKKLNEKVERGNSYLANYALAYLYLEGKHVKQDLVKARELLAFPASGNYANAAALVEQLNTDDKDAASVMAATSRRYSPFDPTIEVITVKGLSYDLSSITNAVMDQLRLSHGQTGSRIKGNGCTERMPGCEIIDASKPANAHSSFLIE